MPKSCEGGWPYGDMTAREVRAMKDLVDWGYSIVGVMDLIGLWEEAIRKRKKALKQKYPGTYEDLKDEEEPKIIRELRESGFKFGPASSNSWDQEGRNAI